MLPRAKSPTIGIFQRYIIVRFVATNEILNYYKQLHFMNTFDTITAIQLLCLSCNHTHKYTYTFENVYVCTERQRKIN